MKSLGILLLSLAFVLLSAVNSLESSEFHKEWNQLQEELPKDFDIVNQEEPVELNRQKRLTCDIDRGFCIAHCVLKGYRLGVCTQNKICVCRR